MSLQNLLRHEFYKRRLLSGLLAAFLFCCSFTLASSDVLGQATTFAGNAAAGATAESPRYLARLNVDHAALRGAQSSVMENNACVPTFARSAKVGTRKR